jgi:hypothetical protein
MKYIKRELISKYTQELKSWQVPDGDTEIAHKFADRALCDLLRELGFGEVVDEYNKIDKWYS